METLITSLKNIAGIIQYVIVIGGFIGLVMKKPREKMIKWLNNKIRQVSSEEDKNKMEPIEKKIEQIFNMNQEQMQKFEKIEDDLSQHSQKIVEFSDGLAGIRQHLIDILAVITALKTSQLNILRGQINKIYYRYIDLGYLPMYEREFLDKIYKDYKTLGGNSYIEDLYFQLIKLPPKE